MPNKLVARGDILRYQIYGGDNKPTVYYFTGYGIPLKKVRPHISALKLLGFRVFGFEYDRKVLSTGDPLLLLQIINDIRTIVRSDAQSHSIAGIYGISLGSFIGFNILKQTDISRAILNTGGVSAVKTIWENQHLIKEKQAFEATGISRRQLAKAWRKIDSISALNGKHILLMISTGDTVLNPAEAAKNVVRMLHVGGDVMLKTSRHLDHSAVIVRNLFKVDQLRKFYAPNDTLHTSGIK